MRQIKFRGKRIDNGEWIYGYYVGNDLIRDNTLAICYSDNQIHLRGYRVDPATVGQFTGMKTKDGQELYEHDIVKDGCGQTCVIRWVGVVGQPDGNGDLGRFWLFTKADDVGWNFAKRTSMIGIKKLGNLHDNPDLIGGRQGE